MSNGKDAKSALTTIKSTIGDVLHLQVITAVGKFDIEDGDVKDESINKMRKLFTRIGLLDGDITTAMDEEFLSNEAYAGLRDFHQDTVAQGTAIVHNNVKALKELVILLKGELEAEKKA